MNLVEMDTKYAGKAKLNTSVPDLKDTKCKILFFL